MAYRITHNANCVCNNKQKKKGDQQMIKKLHGFMLSSLLEGFARISYDLNWGSFCFVLFGEPDIEIPDEE